MIYDMIYDMIPLTFVPYLHYLEIHIGWTEKNANKSSLAKNKSLDLKDWGAT